MQTELENVLQDWVDDLNLAISFKNSLLATEIMSAILKYCQDKNLNKQEVYSLIDKDIHKVVKNIIKIQYSPNYFYFKF